MDLFGAAHGWGRGQKGTPLLKIRYTHHLTTMKLATFSP